MAMNPEENDIIPVRARGESDVQPGARRAGHAPWLLAAILLLGLTVRLAYLWELQEHPDFQIPMYFQVDMGFIDNSALDHAQKMRAWCGLPPVKPRFERNIVWRHNPGDPQLRPPAYTFFLSVLYFFLGDSQFGVRLVQMLLGLCSALLGYSLGRRLHGRGAGLLMAAFMAFYWPFIIYEASLHEPVLVIFCSLLFMNAAMWWRERPGSLRALLLGLACGLYTVSSAAIILFLPVLLCWVGWVLYRRNRRGRKASEAALNQDAEQEQRSRSLGRGYILAQAALVLFGFFGALSPVTLMNYQESGEFVLNSYGQGITLYIGNQPESKGYLHGADDLLDRYLGSEAIGLRVDEKVARIDDWKRWGVMARQAVKGQIFAHPLWFVKLCLKRAALFWTPQEISQNITEYADRLFSNVLYRIPGNFGVVFAFFITGIFAYLGIFIRDIYKRYPGHVRSEGFREGVNVEGYTLILLLILVWYGPFIFLWISAHFRAPILPAIGAFAVLALCRIPYRIRRGQIAWMTAGSAFIILVVAGMSMVPFSYDDDIQTWLYFRMQRYTLLKEPEKALAVAERVVQRAPDHLFARRIYAQALLEAGKKQEALQEYENVQWSLQDPKVLASVSEVIGLLRREFGDSEGARRAFLRAVHNDPGTAAALHGLGNIAFEAGEYAEAVEYLEQARKVDPANSNTCFLLGLTYNALGDAARAERAFREGMDEDKQDVWPVIGLANLLSGAGRREEACQLYDQALALQPENAQALQGREQYCSTPDIPPIPR